MYSKHRQEPVLYYRISTHPKNPYEWQPVVTITTPGLKGNFGGDNATYCNPMLLSSEHKRLYLFHRGVSQDPNYLVSDDQAQTWRYGGKLFEGLHGYSPYTKYANNGKDTIHFVATEDHPRNFDNSLYHGYLRGGLLHRTDGSPVAPISTSTNTTIRPWDFTRVYQGGKSNVAWMADMELDAKENPVILFTVQVDGAGLPRGKGGMDHRFHYAHWHDSRWEEHEIAFAGTRLYSGEDDYTGLGAIDPQDTSTVYISTDAHPTSGEALVSSADGKRHHELYRGSTSDFGKSWTWTAVTANSDKDNLRPIIPKWKNKQTALLWLRGNYRNNRGEWDTSVVLSLLTKKGFKTSLGK
jgi:hypothetical protein